MSVSIKAYLRSDGTPAEKDEIRRFAVDPRSLNLFFQLKDKISKIFLLSAPFVVQWKDEEGDLITVSSDEELLSAMQATTESILRIFVKIQDTSSFPPKSGTQTDSSTQASGELHPRITCDGCQGPVHGFRYKCLECPDYDLCHKCESQVTHPQHTMLRMPKPMDAHHAFPFMPWLFGRHGGRHRHGRHAFPGACPRRRAYRQENPTCNKEGEGSADESPNDKYNPFQFQQVLDKIWTVLGGLPQEQNYSPENGAAEGQPPTDAKQDNGFAAREAFLKTIGNSVAAMLDPLGIDVDVDVEHGGIRQPCGNKAHTSETTPPPESNVAQDPKPEEKKTAPVEAQIPIITSTDNLLTSLHKIINASISQVATENKANDGVEKTNQPLYPTLNEDASNENGDWTYIGDKERALIPPVSALVPDTTNQNNADGGAIPKTGPPTTSIADEINLMSAEVQHPNPTIRSALSQMLAMGFTNEGGWLTQLLEVKNGNIDSVLEVLTPVNKSQK